MTDRQDLSHSGCNPTTPTGGDDRSRLISTLHFLGPVTALETVDCQPRPFGSQRLVVLLVGSGPYLSIYQMRSSSSPIDRNLIIRTKVFDYHRIHHITHSRPSNGSTTLTASHLSWQVICFGGDRFSISTIKVIDLDGTSRDSDDELTGPRVLVQKFRSFKATDSIVDALIINQDRNPATLIVLLTSHNQLVLYSYVDETQTLSKVSLLSSADRSLLSSGKILLTDEGDHDCEDFIVRKLKLFSGSIPGSILFWESELIYRRTNSGDRFELIDSCSKPISLCGHKGPVHDISVSRCGRRLASASEDRSIRVWDLKYVSSNPIVLWGHLGRAWRLRWKDDNILTSVAEDCRALSWNLKSEILSSKTSSIKPFSIYDGLHDGKSIWCLSHIPGTDILITGGADGRVCYSLITLTDKNHQDLLRKVEGPPIKAFEISNDGHFLISLRLDGSVVKQSLISEDLSETQLLYSDYSQLLRPQCHFLFEPESEKSLFIFTNLGDFIYLPDIYNFKSSEVEIQNIGVTVTMIKLISNRDRLLALIYDSKFNYCYLFQIFHQKAPGLIYRIFLKNMKALTSMEFSESHHKEKQTFIFVGDSEGNFGGFHTIEEEGEGEIGNLVSIHNDGITKILINKINQSEIYNESISICTLGRDGCMMNISIKIFDKNQVQVLQAHQIPTSRGRLESFFCFNNNDGHILQPKKNDKKHANPDVFSRNKFIVGFEGRKMNIYDISGSMIVSCEIEGSGGKMPKLFKFKAIGSQFRFYYFSQNQIFCKVFSKEQLRLGGSVSADNNEGLGHGREINFVKTLRILRGKFDLVAIGSENGVISLKAIYHDKIGNRHDSVKSRTIFRDHKLNFEVKCIDWIKPSRKDITKSKREGRYGLLIRETNYLIICGSLRSLKIYKITVDFRCGFCTHEEIRVETINHDDDSFINEKWEKIDMEIGVLPLSISTEIVRHSDVDSTEKALNSMDINFEIRFVSMSISRLNEYCSLISLGQSDGKVLILKFHFVKPDEQNYELSHENNAKDKHRLIIFSEFLDDSHNESAYCKGRSILSIDSFLVNWSSNINNKDKKTEGYEKKEMALLVAIGSTDGRVKILRLDFNQSDIHLGHNITINQNNVNCKINDDSRNQPNKMKLDKIFEYAPHQNGVCCLKLKPVVIQNPKKPSENYKNRYVSMEDDREKLIILILTGGDDSLINLQFLKISLKKLSNKLEELDHYYSKNIPNLIEFGNVAIKSAHSAAINDIGIFNYKNINLNHTKKIPTKEITSKYNQSLFLQILLPADKECKEEIVLNEEENSDLIIFSLSSNNLIKKWYIPLKVKKFNISLNQVKDPNLDKFGNDSNQLINTEYQLKPFEGIVSSFDIKGNCNSFENFELKTNVYDCSKFDIIMNESNQDIKLLLPCGNYPYQRYFCSNHFNFFVSKPSTNSECKTINDTYKYDAPTKSDKIEFDFRIYLVGIGLEILKTKL